MGHIDEVETGRISTPRGIVHCLQCDYYQTWISTIPKISGRKEFVCNRCADRKTFQIIGYGFQGGRKPRCKFSKKPANMPRATLQLICSRKNSELQHKGGVK